MRVLLPWPDKLLWPNGSRGHPRAVDRAKKAARDYSSWATIEARQKYGQFVDVGEEITVTLLVHAKPRGPMPDKDNCVAAVKVQLDSIAKQIGVNDRRFSAPIVRFVEPRDGRIIVELSPSGVAKTCDESFAADSRGVEQNEAEECSSTPRPIPETLNRSATDEA